ncbi:hypothetical protein V6N11_020370 [Hibiscus sabdariffa]|uniref:Uncharacterized protein n=1 Tax=Hibiscus sabdariffa TaxID=183260 RepID=A0ABR2Q8J7_9ROSI
MTSPRCTIEPRKECSVLELAVGTSVSNTSARDGFSGDAVTKNETRAQTLGKENVCFTFDSCILALPLIVNGSPTFASTSTVQAESDTRKYEPHGHAHK